jgi:hypothetical protein
MTLSDQAASIETECRHLQLKSEADDKLIDLLKSQNEEQATRITKMQREFDEKLQVMTQQRDEANAKAQEVKGLIETIGKLTLQGIDRMTRRHAAAELTELVDLPKDAAQATIERYREQLDPIDTNADVPLFLQNSRPVEQMRRTG